MEIRFNAYKGRSTATFTCPQCGRPNRTRTFVAEYTVNPFNKNPDESIKQARQVQHEASEAARRERDRFLLSPLCRACEDGLPYSDLVFIRNARGALPAA